MSWIDLYAVFGSMTARFAGIGAGIIAIQHMFFSGFSLVDFGVGVFWLGIFALIAWLAF